MDAKSIMKTEPFCVHGGTSILATLAQMQNLGIGHFPVVSDNILVGLVSETHLLPFSSPPNCPAIVSHKRFLEAEAKNIIDVMIPIEDLIFIYEDEDHATFIEKFFRQTSPSRNLMLVVKNPTQRDLRGVISWVDLFRNWSSMVGEQFDDLTCQQVAVRLTEVPTLRDKKHFSVGAALVRANNTRHRHIQIIKNDQLIALYHFHELAPYRPIDMEDITQVDYYEELDFITDLTPRHSIKDRLFPADASVKDAIDKILLSVQSPKKWQDRMAGLLLQQRDSTITHLLTPFDIIDQLRQFHHVSKYVVAFHVDSGKKPIDERLKISVFKNKNSYRLYSLADSVQIPEQYITIEQNVFFEDANASLMPYRDIKGKLSVQEVTVLNLFLDTMG